MNRPPQILITDDNINFKALIFWKFHVPYELKSNHRADFSPSSETPETAFPFVHSAAIIGLSLILLFCLLVFASQTIRRWFNRRYSFEAGIARMSEVKPKTPNFDMHLLFSKFFLA